MKVCPECQRSFQDHHKFCPDDGSPLKSTAHAGDPMIGRVLCGRWEVLERIGSGGFGTVYKVYDTKGGWVEALKVFNPHRLDPSGEEQAMLRFRREATILKRLGQRSPHIVGLTTFEDDPEEGLVYFTMEYVEGETLARIVARDGPFSPDRVTEIVLQVCDALSVAHEDEDRVVHRDLKLENIMLTRAGTGSEMVKVLDFGIAKIAGRQSITNLTGHGVPGTAGYVAPEQIRGDELDGRTDLFALGVVMYGMLTGRDPWLGGLITQTTKRVYQQIRQAEQGKAIPPREYNPDVPPELERIVLKLLRPRPEDRYDSARELKEVLLRMQDEEVSVLPGSLRVVTEEPGANVVVRSGMRIVARGPTPWFAQALVPGVYRILLEDERYQPASREVTLPPGGELEVTLTTSPRLRRSRAAFRPLAGIGYTAAAAVVVVSGVRLWPGSPVPVDPQELRELVREGAVSTATVSESGARGTLVRKLGRDRPFWTEFGGRPADEIALELVEAPVRVDVTPLTAYLTAQGNEALRNDDYGGAFGYALRARSLAPSDSSVERLATQIGQHLAQHEVPVALRAGDYETASRLLDQCFDLVPDHPGCLEESTKLEASRSSRGSSP